MIQCDISCFEKCFLDTVCPIFGIHLKCSWLPVYGPASCRYSASCFFVLFLLVIFAANIFLMDMHAPTTRNSSDIVQGITRILEPLLSGSLRLLHLEFVHSDKVFRRRLIERCICGFHQRLDYQNCCKL